MRPAACVDAALGCLLAVQGPRPPPASFHLTAFDSSSCPPPVLAGNFALVRIMRTRVFTTELRTKGDFDELDASSRHVLGLSESPGCVVVCVL